MWPRLTPFEGMPAPGRERYSTLPEVVAMSQSSQAPDEPEHNKPTSTVFQRAAEAVSRRIRRVFRFMSTVWRLIWS